MSQLVPNLSYFENENEFLTMYDWNPKLNSDFQLEGLNCGVPTRTTPTITPVTPTTLRNLEQTFLDYQQEIESHQNEAGFVPPLVQPTTTMPNSTSGHISVSTAITDLTGGGSLYLNLADTKIWQGGSTTINDLPPLIPIGQGALSPPIPPHVMSMDSSSSSTTSSSSSSSRRNIGGRRPNKENGISPEEEERRKLRRERNKQAAARCRKRRVDHTNQLLKETEDLESKKQRLEEEIVKFKNEKEELLAILETHECRLRDTDSPPDIKPFVNCSDMFATNKGFSNQMCIQNESISSFPTSGCDTRNTSDVLGVMSKPRPNFLPVTNSFFSKNTGIPITTPSTEFIDALIESGAGLTPITSAIVSSCSTQLRSSNAVDLSSPDATVKKLVSL